MRHVLAGATAISVVLLASPVSAAYMPDNNGRFVWSAERSVAHHLVTRRSVAKRSGSKRASKKSGIKETGGKSPPWNMVRVKTVQGFYLTVHPAYAHKFLKLFALLEENHVKVPKEIVGCFSRGGHVRGSNHYIGAACDIQTGWNKTIPVLYTAEGGKWIRQAGLFNGCSFGDCGHIEAVRGTHNRAPNLYASVQQYKIEEATLNYQP